ncbi:polyamine transport [Fusarium beomiforme]|uniref:Polyamine transport n=1 Tax=Fusarium beomiforme TaxID=44412 RepID=A0A9P5A553_9HYPO|nr:polyamine transport [Fusarium beomiforme]
MGTTKNHNQTNIACLDENRFENKKAISLGEGRVFPNTSHVDDKGPRQTMSLNTRLDTHLCQPWDHDSSSHNVGSPALPLVEDQILSATNMNRPVRSQSSGSIMSYLWKSQSLKRPSRTAKPYNSRLTELPPRTISIRADDRRPTEPVLPNSMALRRMSAWSSLSGRSDTAVDGILFKRAFSDLKRLLDEALSLALEVADHSEATAHSDYSAMPNQYSSDPGGGSDELLIKRAQENAKLSPLDGEDTICQARPGCRRAATYTALPKRRRLADVVESYSRTCQDLRAKTRTERIQQRDSSRRSSLSRKSRKSKQVFRADRRRRPIMLNDLRSISGLINAGVINGLGETIAHKRSAAVNILSAVRSGTGHDALPEHDIAGRRLHGDHGINLRKRSYVSLRDMQGFNLPKSYIRQPIARDWSPVRKRFVASTACLSTALIGVLLGIYTGLVPSIQYYIVDQSHITVHGNTGCFLALAIPSFFLWPLPLLHGRKPYIMSSLIIAMPLLFPQAIAVGSPRLTNTASWRAVLLASRTLMGGSLGFASMNFHSVLTDLFGASLMCQHPHEEVVDHFDARRHGGGMGIWLGIWTWCWIGSLGIGFLIGAAIIDKHPPAWGFYISIMMIAVVLILNVICPEVRRSAFRRSIAEVRTGGEISRRLARGEVMMHRVKTGPKWWGQEAYHGVRLSLDMLEQPGFAVLAVYVSWIYAQVVLVIILLGSLVSRFYHLRSPYVGLHIAAVALGALLAIPFQKASIFSRSRKQEGKVNREIRGRRVVWSSHLVRRAVFTIALPIGGACYAAVSSGPPINSGVPTFFALCIGFLSCLAISECNGLVMETFDTSDLSPGMVGRHRDPSGQDPRRTNYSSFPRVTAGFAMIQSFSYILAAGSTALGGHVTRKLGQQIATSVVAAILFLLTVLLLLVLIRFKNVLIIPRSKSEEMERITQARRRSSKRRASMPNDLRALMEEDYAWRPIMIGNPIGKNRRMNVLEMGNLTRWQDIRRRNKLIDAGVHLNRDTLDQGLEALDAALENHIDDMRQNASGFFRRGSLRKHGSRLRRSNQSSEQTFHDFELDMLDPVGTPSESSQQPRQYVERECVMSQTIKEENKDEAQVGLSTLRKDQNSRA